MIGRHSHTRKGLSLVVIIIEIKGEAIARTDSQVMHRSDDAKNEK